MATDARRLQSNIDIRLAPRDRIGNLHAQMQRPRHEKAWPRRGSHHLAPSWPSASHSSTQTARTMQAPKHDQPSRFVMQDAPSTIIPCTFCHAGCPFHDHSRVHGHKLSCRVRLPGAATALQGRRRPGDERVKAASQGPCPLHVQQASSTEGIDRMQSLPHALHLVRRLACCGSTSELCLGRHWLVIVFAIYSACLPGPPRSKPRP